ncbi:hypothetical protein Tdes44962_MAKER00710 [Teratosphaeria destructans]|uniref:Uncharacterized protein n=1 Tax=Teratosphaeria destructans TaxID=418781 RepID=A0A9W7SM13_9PEZI|nr:hypothetical protein Tdes44962_MAKER00710 [Teratosphaeria destructans]
MPAKKGARAGRAPPSIASRIKANDKKQPSLKAKDSTVKKSTQGQRKRPIQPRIAKALQDAVEQAPPKPEAEILAVPSVPAHESARAKVRRITNSSFQATPASLFFVKYCGLNTSADTETIALNLLDHFTQPHHALPQLWYGRLHAVSFLLACKLTGVENSIEAVAKAVETQACGLAATESYWSSALVVPVEDVTAGLKAVMARREEIMGLVGDYGLTLTLEQDAVPLVDGVHNEAIDETGEEGVNGAIELEVDLFDFDTYQESEEGT